MSWRIKRGDENLLRLYRTRTLKSNRLAYLSCLANDQAAVEEAFTQLGDDWEQAIWQTVATYQVTKKWAFSG